MTRRLKDAPVFGAIIFLFLIIVIYTSQSNESIRVKMPQIETRHSFVSSPSEVRTNNTEPRLNVILLTHMSSGSTVVGNMLNLHPDVFYIYEPLHALRRNVYRNEWRVLDKSQNDAFRKDFSILLNDLFTCGFQDKRTIELVFPKWVRYHDQWHKKSTPLTRESLRKACNGRKITVTKIMQTRLPREIGIREVERVCRSDPSKFDCLIVHLVKDPRAVLSSLIKRHFIGKTGKSLSPQGIGNLNDNAHLLCSLVSENLDYVNTEWSNWFKSRYILVRYEDVISNMSRAVYDMYKSIGLPMVETIVQWIKGVPPPGRAHSRGMVISNADVTTIDQWRFRESSSRISLFEEACGPLMEAMGYVFINGSKKFQHNKSKTLRTPDVPFLRDLHQ